MRKLPEQCWEWPGGVNGDGYARAMHNGVRKPLHRALMEGFHGPLPKEVVVMHTCDNPRCVNPAHLELGTAMDNWDDMRAKGRNDAARGEGHPNAKITLITARKIRASKKTEKELAKEFGLSPGHIHRIKAGTSWKEAA